MESPFCGPHISTHALPLDGKLTFYLKMIYFLENDLESPLIFLLFLKGKKNKKENPRVTPYLVKVVCEKSDRVQGSGYLSGRYDKDRSIPLSP